MSKSISRRDFLRLVGGTAAVAVGSSLLPARSRRWLLPVDVAKAAPADAFDLHFAGTDGWMWLPPTPAIPPFHPDDLAPAPFNSYIFGFHNVTGLNDPKTAAQKMKAQHIAPLFWANQYQPGLAYPDSNELRVKLTNLGLAMRPDLVDAHTLHWHGVRDAIPFFDGEPHGGFSIPINRDFIYVYRIREPGTYMYHCHVEDVEHVHMGMTGLVFVRPAQDGNTTLYPSGKYAYNDGNGSTGFDREFALLLTEFWANSHWADSHIQLPEWSDYRPDYSMINGRVYPDTLLPNSPIDMAGSTHALAIQTDNGSGDMLATPGLERLQYQPYSSLVQCNAGERVLLRIAQLGFMQASLTLSGIKMKVVGKDATLLRGRDGSDSSYLTETLSMGAGESYDAIFTAPPYVGPGLYDTYLLYNRAYNRHSNLSDGGYGGQMTEVRVYPAGTLSAQTLPNT